MLIRSPELSFEDIVGGLPDAINPLALSLNENPFPPLPTVRTAMTASLDAANRYPELLPERLRSLVAAHNGVRDEQVVLGVGATGVTLQILLAATSPGDRFVTTVPAYDGFAVCAQMARLQVVSVGLDPNGHQNLCALADAAADARVVAVCRPHNPTGTIEPAVEIERLLHRIPVDTVVLLDEAYAEFLSHDDRIDAAALVSRFPNVVVLRTFSKAYGLAGLRIGYAFCAVDLATELWKMQLPFGICATSLAAVAASYQAETELWRRIRSITYERRYLQTRLRRLGIPSTDSHANFVFLPARDRSWREVFDGTGVQVRHYADGAVRIAVGVRSSSQAVIAAIGGHRDAQ